MINKITLSKEFIERCKHHKIDDVKNFCLLLIRKFVPVQQLSDAMKGTNQCSFNLDLDKNTLEVIDPFNLFDCDVNKFNLEEPRTNALGCKVDDFLKAD